MVLDVEKSVAVEAIEPSKGWGFRCEIAWPSNRPERSKSKRYCNELITVRLPRRPRWVFLSSRVVMLLYGKVWCVWACVWAFFCSKIIQTRYYTHSIERAHWDAAAC